MDGYGLNGWELNPAPNFFPDMIIYFLISFITGENFIATSFIFSFIQYFLIFYLFYRILKHFYSQKEALLLTSLGNLFLSLILIHFIVVKEMWFTFQILSNSFHLGIFVITLLLALLVLKHIKTKRNIHLLYIFILVILVSFSDKLFIAQFSGVLTLVLGVSAIINGKYWNKQNTLLLTTILTGSGLGVILINQIDPSFIRFGTPYSQQFDLETIQQSFYKQINHLYEIVTESWAGLLIILSIIISNLLLSYTVIKNISSKQKSTFFWISLVILTYNFCSFILPSLTGAYMGFDCIRYNINVYITSLMLLPFSIYFRFDKKTALAFTSPILLILVTIITINVSQLKTPSEITSYYPKQTNTLDSLKKQYQLKNGIGNYWYAKFNTMFSKNGLRIYSTHNTLAKYEHVTNQRWYHETSDNKPATFNFILIDDDEQIVAVKKHFKEYEMVSKEGVTICITPNFTFVKNKPFPVLLNSLNL